MSPERRRRLLEHARKIQTRSTSMEVGALAGILAEVLADTASVPAQQVLTAEDTKELDGIFASMDRLFARIFKR